MGDFVRNQEIENATDQDLALLKYLPELSPVRSDIISEMVRKLELRKQK